MGNDLEVFYNENIDNARNPFLGRTLGSGAKYSEKTKELLDKESLELVIEAYDKAKNILSEHREKMDILINKLIEKNILYGYDL
jgi:cell division protease FtsH